MRIVGDLFLDTQMFLAGFYVSKFPSDEQAAAVIQKWEFAQGVKKTA
jgi:hypothetical protein